MVATSRGSVLLLFALLASGIASAADSGFRCSKDGGPEWREYRSTHFVIDSDAPRYRVEKLFSQLETLQALDMQALFNDQVEIPGHLRVLAFDSPTQFTGRSWPAPSTPPHFPNRRS